MEPGSCAVLACYVLLREVPEQPPVGTMDEWLGLIGWVGVAVNLVVSTGGFEAVNWDVEVSQDFNGKPTIRRPSKNSKVRTGMRHLLLLSKVLFVHRILKQAVDSQFSLFIWPYDLMSTSVTSLQRCCNDAASFQPERETKVRSGARAELMC